MWLAGTAARLRVWLDEAAAAGTFLAVSAETGAGIDCGTAANELAANEPATPLPPLP